MAEPLLNEYTVPVRILADPRGLLLVPSAAELDAKYRDMADDVDVALAHETEEARRAQRKRLDAARTQEKELFAQLEAVRGAEFQTFRFVFRLPTIEDELSAERAAEKSPPRELSYRLALAQSTLLSSDFPGFENFGKLRTDVALLVLRECVKRLTFAADPRDFLLPNDADTAAQPEAGSGE